MSSKKKQEKISKDDQEESIHEEAEDPYNCDTLDYRDIDGLEDPANEENDDEKDLIKDSEDYKARVKKSGVIYISYIPDGLTVAIIRKKLSKYGVRRVFLKPISGKKNHFKEGWLEFESKIMAKLCEYELNGQPIGGKKRDAISEEIWTFKYLHKFKWHHLVDKLQMKQKTKEEQLKTTINQSHREVNFIQDSMQLSKKKRVRDEHNPDSIDVYKRNVVQTKAVSKKK